ncbi:MAG TPA: putative LPS assembly protein LptD, partial [Blastocatellia bacterium]|nr:putative LPS assembly protein LptD [Blastocatellia bacterium]
MGDMRLQADRVTFNNTTGDMVAEGNVIFDEGADQRVTARRAEINWNSRRGVFWETTGFTNRTQTGEYLYFTAERIEKTGPDTYELTNSTVTACEDAVPKWSFSAHRAELEVDDRLKLHNSVFRVKTLPVFVLPYAWIPVTKTERKSGFLIPTTGSSNQKGRTIKTAYYQTLGPSADITFRNDVYTARGLGFGAEFRAQTDERSFMRLGVFTVKDRLFGDPGENQGGTAFVGEAVQYLPRGWLAVGNVSLVTSLRFRQAFSDDISQVIDPRRESTFYANNNTGNVSFNFLASNETTRLFRPSPDAPDESLPGAGTDFDVKVRRAPGVDLTFYPKRIVESLPIYLSIDSSIGALKREETATTEGNTVLVTPSAVQRFDLKPKITMPLATFAGIAITPSLSLRETFYTSSIDPDVPAFAPERFALTPGDPRLNPASFEFDPGVTLFDRNSLDPVTSENISRLYGELEVDVRPPALEREFLNDDGSRRFKHLIEPYVTYRLIKGIGEEFDRIILFDERDAVANTNEVEYSIVNRFFTTRHTSQLQRRRRRRRTDQPDRMDTARPEDDRRRRREDRKAKPAPATETSPQSPTSGGEAEKKARLERGQQAELEQKEEPRRPRAGQPQEAAEEEEEESLDPGNEDSPAQPYELLTVKVAQKYFFDRDFGGALVEGRRNQFYPINTLSGFTFGGRERSFSPLNFQLRYRPLSAMYADLRMDIGKDDHAVRNLIVGAGVTADRLAVSASYNLSRRIDLAPNRFEPGTFPGNQITTAIQFGDETRGLYVGARIAYDFTDRFEDDGTISSGRLRSSRSFLGYQWDCCGVQFNYNTFKAGLRNESSLSFTFTLAGLGSFGTDQFSQLGGGRGGRGRGRKARRQAYEDIY